MHDNVRPRARSTKPHENKTTNTRERRGWNAMTNVNENGSRIPPTRACFSRTVSAFITQTDYGNVKLVRLPRSGCIRLILESWKNIDTLFVTNIRYVRSRIRTFHIVWIHKDLNIPLVSNVAVVHTADACTPNLPPTQIHLLKNK